MYGYSRIHNQYKLNSVCTKNLYSARFAQTGKLELDVWPRVGTYLIKLGNNGPIGNLSSIHRNSILTVKL